MTTTVIEAANSTPEHPRYVWRVWRNGREVAMGFTDAEGDAQRQAERTRARIEARLEGRRYNEILEEGRTDEQNIVDWLQG